MNRGMKVLVCVSGRRSRVRALEPFCAPRTPCSAIAFSFALIPRRLMATKKTRSQLEPGIGDDKPKPTGPERTLEVNCSNCGAKFVAYYGYDQENVEARPTVSGDQVCSGY